MKRTFVLVHDRARAGAVAAMNDPAYAGHVVTISEPRRSTEQSDKLHAMLGEIAEQKQWNNERLSIEEWKRLFSAAVFREKMLPGLNGGIVIVPKFTRSMTKGEMSELIEFVYAWCAENEIELMEPTAA